MCSKALPKEKIICKCVFMVYACESFLVHGGSLFCWLRSGEGRNLGWLKWLFQAFYQLAVFTLTIIIAQSLTTNPKQNQNKQTHTAAAREWDLVHVWYYFITVAYGSISSPLRLLSSVLCNIHALVIFHPRQ